jgi:hypothetical protein
MTMQTGYRHMFTIHMQTVLRKTVSTDPTEIDALACSEIIQPPSLEQKRHTTVVNSIFSSFLVDSADML